MAERLVVIGGDAAGMSAASAARRQLSQDQLEIVAFERGHYTSYSACGIPYFIGKDVTDTTALIARTPQQFRDHHDIDARIGHEVLEIDLNRPGDNRGREIGRRSFSHASEVHRRAQGS